MFVKLLYNMLQRKKNEGTSRTTRLSRTRRTLGIRRLRRIRGRCTSPTQKTQKRYLTLKQPTHTIQLKINTPKQTHIDVFNNCTLFEMDDIPKYMVLNPLFLQKQHKSYTDRFYDSVVERLRELETILVDVMPTSFPPAEQVKNML